MDSPPEFRGAASRWAARVTSSRFAALVARAVLAAACVALLAIIGYAADAGSRRALASSAPLASTTAEASLAPPAPIATPAAPASAPAENAHPQPAPASPSSRGTASPEDPVVLNTATIDEFRRLPGIGEKRAAAMIALRARLGRFRAVEDLLKVKGIGRAMLKRIRPLVRLDPRVDLNTTLDAGS